jgi:hypothetical protein
MNLLFFLCTYEPAASELTSKRRLFFSDEGARTSLGL